MLNEGLKIVGHNISETSSRGILDETKKVTTKKSLSTTGFKMH